MISIADCQTPPNADQKGWWCLAVFYRPTDQLYSITCAGRTECNIKRGMVETRFGGSDSPIQGNLHWAATVANTHSAQTTSETRRGCISAIDQ